MTGYKYCYFWHNAGASEKGGRGILGEVPRLVESSSFLHQFCCWSLAFFPFRRKEEEGGGKGSRRPYFVFIAKVVRETLSLFPPPEEEVGKRSRAKGRRGTSPFFFPYFPVLLLLLLLCPFSFPARWKGDSSTRRRHCGTVVLHNAAQKRSRCSILYIPQCLHRRRRI